MAPLKKCLLQFYATISNQSKRKEILEGSISSVTLRTMGTGMQLGRGNAEGLIKDLQCQEVKHGQQGGEKAGQMVYARVGLTENGSVW